MGEDTQKIVGVWESAHGTDQSSIVVIGVAGDI